MILDQEKRGKLNGEQILHWTAVDIVNTTHHQDKDKDKARVGWVKNQNIWRA